MAEKILSSLFSIKESFLHGTLYHYGALGFTLFVALLLFVLGIMLRKKAFISSLMIILSLLLFFVGPFVSFIIIEEIVRKPSFSHLRIQQLIYVDDIIIRGVITNEGKLPISSCTITATRCQTDQNEYLKLLYSFKSLSSETTTLPLKLDSGESSDFQVYLPGRLKSGETIYIQGFLR